MDKTTERQLFSKDFSLFSADFYECIIDTSDLSLEDRTKEIAKRLEKVKIKNKEAAMLLYLIILINEYSSSTYANMRDNFSEGIADLFLAHIFVLSFNKYHYFRQDDTIEKTLKLQGKLCSFLYSYCLLMSSSDLTLHQAINDTYTYYVDEIGLSFQRLIETYFIIIDELEYLKESFEITYNEKDNDDIKIVKVNNETKGTIH